MNELIELRSALKKAEQEYYSANTSLEGSLSLILAREQLKQARFSYSKVCEQHIEELYFTEDGA